MNKQEVIERINNESWEYWEPKAVNETETVRNILNQIHEPQKVVIPKHVAEWIEECKDKNRILYFAMNPNRIPKAVNEWLTYDGNDDIFARAWLDGYEVEQEKLYTVELKNGQPLVGNDVLYFSQNLADVMAKVTKSALEKSGFGWVFDCEGVEVMEVTE